jgi:hypothetical protein
MLTVPNAFIRFLPSFCFSSSLRLRETSPPWHFAEAVFDGDFPERNGAQEDLIVRDAYRSGNRSGQFGVAGHEPEEIDERLALKVGKIITSVGTKGLKQLGKTRPTLRKETFNLLTTGRVYMLDPNKTFAPAG